MSTKANAQLSTQLSTQRKNNNPMWYFVTASACSIARRKFVFIKNYTVNIFCIVLGGVVSSTYAQQNELPSPDRLILKQSRSLELSIGAQKLTAGYSSWRDVTVRGTIDTGAHVLQGELAVKNEFDKSGTFLGGSNVFELNRDWYASVSAGAGDGAFYLPRFRTDGFIHKKWLDKRNLVTSLGLGYYRAPDGHVDRSLTLSAMMYFDAPWVVEGGVRYNRSSPGAIMTHQKFVAVTYGRDKQDQLSGRYAWGGEGYQSIAENATLVNFQSQEASLLWRHWMSPRTGFLVDVNHYRNPTYERSGAHVGVFQQFD